MTPLADTWIRAATLHLWQASLFGLAITLVLAVLPGPARLRHFAAMLGLLRFLIPAALLAPLLVHLPMASTAGIWKAMGLGNLMMPVFVVWNDKADALPLASQLPLSLLLIALWSAGTFVLLSVWTVRLVRGLRVLRRQAVPFSPGEAQRLERLVALVGLAPGSVSGFTASSHSWLGVVGLFRSRVIIPEGLFAALEEKEVESVLLHELMHVKRHDNLLRLLQVGVVALFWFHPLVWWLDRRLHWESESACDDAVLRLTGANRVYATGLFKAVQYALELNLPGVSGMSRMGLKSRIHAVLNHQNRKDSPVKIALVTSALVGLLGLTTMLATPAIAADPVDTPKAAVGDVYNVADLDQPPVSTYQAKPVYPAELRKAGVTGKVVVAFVVDRDGNTIDVQVFESSDPRFNKSAIDAVQLWKFKPGMRNGKPVNARLQVPIVFEIAK